jgi:hypothetical protein
MKCRLLREMTHARHNFSAWRDLRTRDRGGDNLWKRCVSFAAAQRSYVQAKYTSRFLHVTIQPDFIIDCVRCPFYYGMLLFYHITRRIL